MTVTLAVAVFLWLALPATGAASEGETGHAIAIETVRPGQEGLELTARLTPEGGPIERNIAWTIRTADGGTAFAGESGTADVAVPPGDYIVEAQYGAARLSSSVSLPKATRLRVSFVLNAGALRVAPRLNGIDMAVPSRVKVYALAEGGSGRLIGTSAAPGDLIRLPEGRYRVESRVINGNAGAVADVAVKGGRVSWIDISLKAGLARLAFVGSPSAQVIWSIEDERGARIATHHGLDMRLVLQPGTYRARAEIGPELLTATFKVAAGETRDILLGN